MKDAAAALVALVHALIVRLEPWLGPVPVARAGGLLAPGRPLHDVVARRLLATPALPPIDLLQSTVDGARGAARLARIHRAR
jgi:hypothetical protein